MDKRLKTVAFPKEHGSWALTFEPLILALIVGYSLPGLFLFFGAAFAFLAHQPARILLTKGNYRTQAVTFLFIYGLPAAVFMLVFLRLSTWNTSLPLLIALALMFAYLIAEYFSLHRELITELMASVAMGLIALSIVLSGGWDWPKAFPFLILLYLRSLSTTLYVHYRLKLERKLTVSTFWSQIWQVLTLIIAFVLLFENLVPFLASLSILILGIRGIYGLSPWRKPMTVKQIGLAEFFFGLIFVLFTAVGYLI